MKQQQIDKLKFVIAEMYKYATRTYIHSVDKYFMLDLEAWCNQNGKDFRVWQASMYRLFSLHNKFPYTNIERIVGYVFKRDKEKLLV